MALTNEAVAGNVTNNTLGSKVNILDGYNVAITVPAPFTGSTASTRGAFATKPTFPLFTTRGEVKVIVYGVCTTDLAGATSTIEIGVAGNTALVLPQVVGTTIAANDVYVDASVGEIGGFVATSLPAATYLTNSQTINETCATANMTSGNIYYVCLWIPVSADATVKAVAPFRVN